MKSIMGVFPSYNKAVTAVQELKKSGYGHAQLSILGKADLIDGHIQVSSGHAGAKLNIGIATAAVLEALAVAGIFVVPGFGLLFGAGAIVGVFAGVDIALFRALFEQKDVSDEDLAYCEKNLNEGRFLVFADGDEHQLEHAHRVLQGHGVSKRV